MNKIINNLIEFKKDKTTLIIILILAVILLIIGTKLIGFLYSLLIVLAIIIIPLFFYKSENIINNVDKEKGSDNMSKSKNSKSKRKIISKKKKILNIFLIIVMSVFLLLILGVLFGVFYIINKAPDFDPENLYKKEASILYASNGEVYATLGREKREKVTYDELPQVLIDAIIATEDSRFFQHNGVDLPRFTKATIEQLLGRSDAGGASTLSMQIVKNNFTSKDKSLTRKFTDIYLAVNKLEKNYSKKQIMEYYVNIPYLGGSSYGVEQACQTYFNKSVKDITLPEAALIAGLFQAPNTYDPFLRPEKSEERRNIVLNLMVRHGYITKEEKEKANTIHVSELLVGKGGSDNPYQGFVDHVVEEAIKKTGMNPYDEPMLLYTTMIKSKQDSINNILLGVGGYTFINDQIQAGIAVSDINSGAIVALGAGRNRSGERSFNYATMLNKQPGSSIKPIMDYGPGIEYNNWSTYQQFNDEPHPYSNGKTMTNWDDSYIGWGSLRKHLGMSRNVPALKAFQQIDNRKIAGFVKSLGIKAEVDVNGRLHEAHSIGGFNGVSPLQMSAAYGAFGNGGYYIEPYSITKIIYRDDNKEVDLIPKKNKVMQDATAFMITKSLVLAVQEKLVVTKAIDGIEFAAKTGTSNFDSATRQAKKLPSNAVNDLWTIGYSPDYSIALWYGYDIPTREYCNNTNSYIEKEKLFNTIARSIFEWNGKTFKMPDSVVEVLIEPNSNPAALAPQGSTYITKEWFKKGTEPTEISIRYNGPNSVNGLNPTYSGDKIILNWTYKNNSTYDEEIHGEVNFNIYLIDNNNDELIKLATVSDYTYTYNIPLEFTDGMLTFVVKSLYTGTGVMSSDATTTIELVSSGGPTTP